MHFEFPQRYPVSVLFYNVKNNFDDLELSFTQNDYCVDCT